MPDQRWYDQGLRPRVLINWRSFADRGIPNDWQWPFTDAVLNAYTRWMNVGGVDLRFQFYGFTDQTESASGELVISMNDSFPGTTRLASTFGTYNRLIIVFHRANGTDNSPWPFVPFNADVGEFDMQAILMHELGHCLGLDHSDASTDTMNGSYYYERYRYGPFANDVARLRNVYSRFTRNRLRQFRSGDGGGSWSGVANDLTTQGNEDARTNLSPGAVATPQTGLSLVGWSVPSNPPSWVRGDGEHFFAYPWFVYGGERSIYGPAYARDDERTMLWAWVADDNAGTIKIVRSTNEGQEWQWVAVPAAATTFGTPGLCWTRVDGQSTWILVWPHFDPVDHPNTGFLRTSISTDNGDTWSAPQQLNGVYKALSGVAAAADANNRIEVAVAWAPHGTYGMNRIRTFVCRVGRGRLEWESTIFSDETTRIQPALAYDGAAASFVLAWRAQDFNTSIGVARHPGDGRDWSRPVWPGASSHVAPALAYSPRHRETVLWYAYE